MSSNEDEQKIKARKADKITPGDNPNKNKATGKSKYKPKKENVSAKEYTFKQYADPNQYAHVLTPDNLTDTIAPGKKVVGTVTLSNTFIDNFIEMSKRLVESAQGSLNVKIQFPNLVDYTSIVTRICFATQLYETLQLLAEDGQVYKLKALKYAKFSVPEFITVFVNCVGHFEAREGVIRINSAETKMLQQLDLAINEFNDIHPVKGFKPIVPNYTYLWDTFDFTQIRDQICEDYFVNLSNTDFVFSNHTVRLPKYTRNSDVDQYISNLMGITGDALLASTTRSYCEFYNLIDYNGFIKLSTITHDNLGFYPSPRSIAYYVETIGYIGVYFQTNITNCFELLFKTKEFKPSSQGTSAQFIKAGKPELVVGMSNSGKHDYSVAISEVAKGFVLLPAEDVVFKPEYTTFSEYNRAQLLNTFANSTRV